MLKIAFYEKDITPPLGGYMWGQYSPRFAEDVLDNLFVKAMVADDGENTVAVISVDTCVLPEGMHEAVTERIKEYTGIPPENVTLCATHTHQGVPISDSPELDVYADAAYKDVLCRLAADCAILAHKRLTGGKVKYAKGHVPSISFVRDFLMKDGSVVTNPGLGNGDIVKPVSENDPDLSTLFFEDLAGKPMGAIISFACHQDCVGGKDYSGDYASVLAKELKKIYGNDFVSVFLLGACGDINHINVHTERKPNRHIEMGQILAAEVERSVAAAKETSTDKVSSEKEYILIDKRLPEDEYVQKMTSLWLEKKRSSAFRTIRNLFAYHAANKDAQYGVYIQSIRIGDALIYALPGEVYSWFGKYIRENSPSRMNLIATLCNGYCGYIPTKEAFEHDLYETSLCKHSCLVPDAGYIISDKILKLAKKQY